MFEVDLVRGAARRLQVEGAVASLAAAAEAALLRTAVARARTTMRLDLSGPLFREQNSVFQSSSLNVVPQISPNASLRCVNASYDAFGEIGATFRALE